MTGSSQRRLDDVRRVPNIVDLVVEDRSMPDRRGVDRNKIGSVGHTFQFTPWIAHEAELVLDVDGVVGVM